MINFKNVKQVTMKKNGDKEVSYSDRCDKMVAAFFIKDHDEDGVYYVNVILDHLPNFCFESESLEKCKELYHHLLNILVNDDFGTIDLNDYR